MQFGNEVSTHSKRSIAFVLLMVNSSRFLLHAVVLPQDLDDAIAGQAKDADAVGAGHRLCREHRVDDGFFGRFGRRSKERIDPIVGRVPDAPELLSSVESSESYY